MERVRLIWCHQATFNAHLLLPFYCRLPHHTNLHCQTPLYVPISFRLTATSSKYNIFPGQPIYRLICYRHMLQFQSALSSSPYHTNISLLTCSSSAVHTAPVSLPSSSAQCPETVEHIMSVSSPNLSDGCISSTCGATKTKKRRSNLVKMGKKFFSRSKSNHSTRRPNSDDSEPPSPSPSPSALT